MPADKFPIADNPEAVQLLESIDYDLKILVHPKRTCPSIELRKQLAVRIRENVLALARRAYGSGSQAVIDSLKKLSEEGTCLIS